MKKINKSQSLRALTWQLRKTTYTFLYNQIQQLRGSSNEPPRNFIYQNIKSCQVSENLTALPRPNFHKHRRNRHARVRVDIHRLILGAIGVIHRDINEQRQRDFV